MAGLEPATSTLPNIGEWRSTIDLHGHWTTCLFPLVFSEAGVVMCLRGPFMRLDGSYQMDGLCHKI